MGANKKQFMQDREREESEKRFNQEMPESLFNKIQKKWKQKTLK